MKKETLPNYTPGTRTKEKLPGSTEKSTRTQLSAPQSQVPYSHGPIQQGATLTGPAKPTLPQLRESATKTQPSTSGAGSSSTVDLKQRFTGPAEMKIGKNDKATKATRQAGTSAGRNTYTMPSTEKWYKGDTPSARETLARIMTVSGNDDKRRDELLQMYTTAALDKTSPLYNPYAGATNSTAIAGLAGILQDSGIEMPEVITGDFLTSLQQYADYEGHVGIAGTPLAPTKKSTPAQDLAYYLYQLQKDEETTQKAENEWEALQAYIKEQVDAGHSDDEILEGINWGKYATLKRMDDGRAMNVPIQLNRGVGYSEDALYGALWAARNGGGSGSALMDAAYYTLGMGNMMATVAQKPYNAAKDVTNYEMYNPYAELPDDFQALANEWGVSAITEEVLQQHRDMLSDPDQQKIWNSAYKAVATTEAVKTQMHDFTEWARKQISNNDERKDGKRRGTALTNEELWAKIEAELQSNSEYSALAKLEEGRVTGKPVALTEAVDFTLPKLKRELFGTDVPEETEPAAEAPLAAQSARSRATAPSAAAPEATEAAEPVQYSSILSKGISDRMQGKQSDSTLVNQWYDEYSWLLGGVIEENNGSGVRTTYDIREQRRSNEGLHPLVSTGLTTEALNALEADRLGVRDGSVSFDAQIQHAVEISNDIESAKAAGLTLEAYYAANPGETEKFDTWKQEAAATRAANQAAAEEAERQQREAIAAMAQTAYTSRYLGGEQTEDTLAAQAFIENSQEIGGRSIQEIADGDELFRSMSSEVRRALISTDGWREMAVPEFEDAPEDANIMSWQLAEETLMTDMKYAAYMGLSLEEFYDQTEGARKSTDQLVGQAMTRYAELLSEYHQELQAAAERAAEPRQPEDAWAEEDEYDHSFLNVTGDAAKAGILPWLAGHERKLAGTEKAILSFVDDVVLRNTDSAYTQFLRGAYTRQEYRSAVEQFINELPETYEQEAAYKAAMQQMLSEYTGDIYDIGVNLDLSKIEQYIRRNESEVAYISDAIAEGGSGLEQMYFSALSSLVHNSALMAESRLKGTIFGNLFAGALGDKFATLSEKGKKIFDVAVGVAAATSTYGTPEGWEMAEKLEATTGMPFWQAAGFGGIQAVATGAMEQLLGLDKVSSGVGKLTSGRVSNLFNWLGSVLDEDNFASLGILGMIKNTMANGTSSTLGMLKNMALAAVPSEAFQEGSEYTFGALFQSAVEAMYKKGTFGEAMGRNFSWGELGQQTLAGGLMALPLAMIGADVGYIQSSTSAWRSMQNPDGPRMNPDGPRTKQDWANAWAYYPGLYDQETHTTARRSAEEILQYFAGNRPDMKAEDIEQHYYNMIQDYWTNHEAFDQMATQVTATEIMMNHIRDGAIQIDQALVKRAADAQNLVAQAQEASDAAKADADKAAKAHKDAETELLNSTDPQAALMHEELTKNLVATKQRFEETQKVLADAQAQAAQIQAQLRAIQEQQLEQLRTQSLQEAQALRDGALQAQTEQEKQTQETTATLEAAERTPGSAILRTNVELQQAQAALQQAQATYDQATQDFLNTIPEGEIPSADDTDFEEAEAPEVAEAPEAPTPDVPEQQEAPTPEAGTRPGTGARTDADAAAGQRSVPVEAVPEQRQPGPAAPVVDQQTPLMGVVNSGMSESMPAQATSAPAGTLLPAPVAAAQQQLQAAKTRVAELTARQQAQAQLLETLKAAATGDEAAQVLADAVREGLINQEDAKTIREQLGIVTSEEMAATPGKPGVNDQTSLKKRHTRDQLYQIRILDELGKRFNLEVVLRDTLNSGVDDGLHLPGTNRVYVSINAMADGVLQAGVHEMVHYIKANSPDSYDAIRQAVEAALEKQGKNLNELAQQRIDDYEDGGITLSYPAAIEEVIAETVPQVFADQEVLTAFQTEHKSAWKDISKAFKSFWQTLQEIVKNVSAKSGHYEVEALLNDSEALKNIYDLFIKGGEAAGQAFVEGGAADQVKHSRQTFTSAATSINSTKAPAIYGMPRAIEAMRGKTVIDVGGGRFDTGVEAAKAFDAAVTVYDPYNRSAEHNEAALAGHYDVALISNVLNVIDSAEARGDTIRTAAEHADRVLVTVYEGDGSGVGRQSAADSWQENRKTTDYVPEIEAALPGWTVERHGKLIEANKKPYNQLEKTFAEQVDDYSAQKIPVGEDLFLGATPQPFLDIGFTRLPFVIDQDHIEHMLKGNYPSRENTEKKRRDQREDHTFSEADVKTLPDKLSHPIAVIASKSSAESSVVALIELTSVNGRKAICPVHISLNGRIQGVDYDVNRLASNYGDKMALSWLQEAVESQVNGGHKLFWLDTEKTSQLLPQPDIDETLNKIKETVLAGEGTSGLIMSITDESSPVKAQPKPQRETSQFKRWFGKSKVVDATGTPKVVYHGTNANFTAFDPNTQGSATDSGDYGAGFYFDENESWAGSFGKNVGAYYLSIKNPLRLEYGQDAKVLISLFKKHGIPFNFDTKHSDGSLISAQDFISRYAAENGSEWNNGFRDDRAGKKAFQTALQSMQIDGVIISDQEYVVFEPTQIKSATDNIGTFNSSDPDIRHSRRSDTLLSEEKTFRELFRKLGLTLTVGGAGYAANPEQRSSYSNTRTGGAHVFDSQDGRAYAREIAKQAGFRLKLTNDPVVDTRMIPNMDPAELAGFSPMQQRDAAVAEFVNRWLYDPAAAKDFAGTNFFNAFEEGINGLGWGGSLREAQERLRRLYDAEAYQRLAARVDLEAEPVQKKVPLGEKLETKLADKTYALAKVTRLLQDQLGKDYDISQDPRVLMLGNGNQGANFVNTILSDRLVDPEGNTIRDDSLQSIMHKVGRNREQDFNTYMALLHATTRDEQGKTVFGLDEQTQRDQENALRQLDGKHPDFRVLAEDLTSWYNDFMQTWVVNTGMLSQEDYDLMHAMYPWYVPTFRSDYRTGEAGGQNRGSGTSGATNGLQKATGSTRDIYNPVVGLAENVQRLVANYRNAEVGRAFAYAIQRTVDNAGIAEIVATPEMDVYQRLDPDSDVLTRVSTGLQRAALRMTGDNIMTVLDGDGTPISVQIHDPTVAEALLHSNPERMGRLFQSMAKVKGLITTTATAMSLGFSLPNVLSDFGTAVMTGSFASNPLTGIGKWLAAAGSYMANNIKETIGRGQTSETYNLYQLFGQLDSRYNLRQHDTARELRKKLYGGSRTFEEVLSDFKRSPVRGIADLALTPLKPYLSAVEWINNNLENATRYAEFKFGKHDLSTYEGRLEAGKAARDVTTDFSRTGSSKSLKEIRSFIPFLGATIEGVNKSIMLMSNENRGRRAAILAKAGEVLLLGVADGLIRAMTWTDDDKEFYEQLQSDYKAKYYIIPTDGNGHFIRIKKSQDSGYLLADAIGNLIAKYATGAEGDVFSDVKETVYNLLHGATDITTVFDPVLDVMQNETWYGTPINSYRMEQLPVTMRYNEDTSELWKGISIAVNGLGLDWSPLDVEYLARQYTGTYGTAFGKALREITNGTATAQSLGQIFLDRLTGRVTIDAATANQASNVFYEGLDFVTKIRAAYTQAQKSGRARSVDQFRYDLTDEEFEDAIHDTELLYKQLGETKKEIAALWDEYAEYDGDEDAQREIRIDIMHTCMEANALIDDYRAAYCYAGPADEAVYNLLNLFTHRKAMTED